MKTSTSNEIIVLAIEAWGKNQQRRVDFTMLAQSLLGMKDSQGQPVMSEHEMNHPAAFLMLNQLAQGVRALTSDEAVQAAWTSTVGGDSSGGIVQRDRQEDATALKAKIAKLTDELGKKDREIKDLKAKR
jgi:hypothetical protein